MFKRYLEVIRPENVMVKPGVGVRQGESRRGADHEEHKTVADVDKRGEAVKHAVHRGALQRVCHIGRHQERVRFIEHKRPCCAVPQIPPCTTLKTPTQLCRSSRAKPLKEQCSKQIDTSHMHNLCLRTVELLPFAFLGPTI